MSDTSIMSVGELIDTAFGDLDVNIVNFKLIQTVLLLIARQLRILERYVAVKIGYPIVAPTGSRLSIREVKVHAMVPKKDKKRKKFAKASGEKDFIAPDGTSTKSKGKRREEDTTTITGDDKSYRKTSADEEYKDKADKRYEDYADDKRSVSSKGKPYSDKTSQRKGEFDTNKIFDSKSDKTKAQKEIEVRGEGGATEKRKGRDGIGERGLRGEKGEFANDIDTEDDSRSTGKSAQRKSLADKLRQVRDKSLRDRSTTSEHDEEYEMKSDKYSSQGKSEDDRRVDKAYKYTDNAEKFKAHDVRDGKEQSYDKKSGKLLKADEDNEVSRISFQSLGSERFVSKDGKRPFEKQDSQSTQRASDKSGEKGKGVTRADKASVKGADSRNSTTGTSESKRKKYLQLLEKLEDDRERVLRVIHQRVDSHEINLRTPTPMASLESIDLQQEKILIVEKIAADKDRVSGKEGKGEKGKGGHQVEEKPKLSVVTQDQFQKLLEVVKELEAKFGPLDFPFLEDLRKGVPMSDALAGLQLASRLDATEKALARMINIVTDIATKTPGVNVKSFTDLKEQYGETVSNLHKAESEYGFHTGPTSVLRVEIGENTGWVSNMGVDKPESKVKTKSSKALPSETISMMSTPMSVAVIDSPDNNSAHTTGLSDVTKKNYVTYEQLENAMQGVYDEYTTILTNLTNRTNQKADSALKTCTKMESDLAKSLAVEKKMHELEEKIQRYAERINILDTGLSTQMINYQEQLTQMQHDLETGLDNMAEALATQTGDTEAMGELNQNFTVLQADFDRTRVMQNDLCDIQEAFAMDLMSLSKEIETLRDAKSDRDEVADALRDKAGLSILNGLVTQVQFDAVQGDLEKRIRQAYDKFNNQEVVWQKAIDDLIREINEKATTEQVESLRDEIQSKINVLGDKINFMVDILGEPSAAAIKRQLFRDTECLSCSTPAKMMTEEPGAPEPVWPEASLSYRKATGEGREGKAFGDGDHIPCIPGMPPPHLIDPRAEICTRYCGGRHTVFKNSYNRAVTTQLPDINVTTMTRETGTAVGDDGKVYKVDFAVNKKPCRPCNAPKMPLTDDKIPEKEKLSSQSSSSMGTPSDLRVYSDLMACGRHRGTDTPPACNN